LFTFLNEKGVLKQKDFVKDFTRLKQKKVFDKPMSTWCLKPCTKCVLYRFYFLKYLKFSFPSKTQFSSHNLFKKRRNIVSCIGFHLSKKGELSKKKKTESFECVVKNIQAWHLRTSLYLTLA